MSLILPFLKHISQVHLCWITEGLCLILTASVSVSDHWGPHLSQLKWSYKMNKHITDQEGTATQPIRPNHV